MLSIQFIKWFVFYSIAIIFQWHTKVYMRSPCSPHVLSDGRSHQFQSGDDVTRFECIYHKFAKRKSIHLWTGFGMIWKRCRSAQRRDGRTRTPPRAESIESETMKLPNTCVAHTRLQLSSLNILYKSVTFKGYLLDDDDGDNRKQKTKKKR